MLRVTSVVEEGEAGYCPEVTTQVYSASSCGLLTVRVAVCVSSVKAPSLTPSSTSTPFVQVTVAVTESPVILQVRVVSVTLYASLLTVPTSEINK